MGWWWSSNPRAATATDDAEASAAPSSSPSSNQQPTDLLPSDQPPNPPPSKEPDSHRSANDQANAELLAFLRELQAEREEQKKQQQQPSSAPSSSSSPPTATAHDPSSASPDQEQDLDISPAALVPTTMSCRTLFDYAFHCQSLGGQFVHVYRYGGMRSCSQHWTDWRFCMRHLSTPAHKRREAVAAYNRAKLGGKYAAAGMPSSEDVWEMRRVPARGAFEGDLGEVEGEMRATEEKERREKAGGD